PYASTSSGERNIFYLIGKGRTNRGSLTIMRIATTNHPTDPLSVILDSAAYDRHRAAGTHHFWNLNEAPDALKKSWRVDFYYIDLNDQDALAPLRGPRFFLPDSLFELPGSSP